MQRFFPLVALVTTSCLASPPARPVPSAAAGPAIAPAAPTASPAPADPVVPAYEPPDFGPLPPPTTAGAWDRQPGEPSPTPSPSTGPTAPPSPWPLVPLPPAPVGRRFGLPGGARLDGPALAPGHAVALRDRAAWEAFWQAHLHVVPAPPAFSPVPAPTPYPLDFAASGVLALALLVGDDEADPVVTHVDEAGVHVAVPPRSPAAGAGTERLVTALYQLPPWPAGAPVRLHRRGDRPGGLALLPATGPTPVPTPTPAPTEPPLDMRAGPADAMAIARACLPAGTADGSRAGVAIALGLSFRPPFGDGEPPSPGRLVGAVGEGVQLWAHSDRGPVRWSLREPAAATLVELPQAASPPPAPLSFPPGWGPTVAGCMVTGRRPGAVEVVAEAGGRQARALLAVRAKPAAAIAFRFADGGQVLPAAEPGARVFTDQPAWAAFWRAVRGAEQEAGRPDVDFRRRSLVAVVEDRAAWSEGPAVLTHVEAGGLAPVVVVPSFDGDGPVRRLRRLWLFQTGALPAGARPRVQGRCDGPK